MYAHYLIWLYNRLSRLLRLIYAYFESINCCFEMKTCFCLYMVQTLKWKKCHCQTALWKNMVESKAGFVLIYLISRSTWWLFLGCCNLSFDPGKRTTVFLFVLSYFTFGLTFVFLDGTRLELIFAVISCNNISTDCAPLFRP